MKTGISSSLMLGLIGSMLAACGGGSSGSDGNGSTDSLSTSDKQMVRSEKAAACIAWKSGGTYTAGEVVTYNGANYTALINQTDYAGTGWNPTVASLFKAGGSCSGSTPTPTPTPTPPPTPPPTPTPTCSYKTWTAGVDYPKGTVVKFPSNGKYYLEVNNGTNGSDGTDPTISTWYWQPTTCSGSTTTPTPTPTPSGSFVVSQSQFNAMFPNANGFYTYANLVAAIKAKYPAFANTGSTTTKLQEAAAFFANVSHETGGLVYINEIAQAPYCGGNGYPCAAGQEYYGRGPLQISWNYNYGMAGAALGLDLIDNPSQVATNGEVTWEVALWYWMTQDPNAGVTPHNSMVNSTNFGQTINAINGGIECHQAAGSVGYQEMQDRVALYQKFTSMLGVPAGSATGC